MQRVSPFEIAYVGPMESAAVFRADPHQVESLRLTDYADGLDKCAAAYFVFHKVPFAVQRHEGNAPGTYTVVVDAAAARQQHVKLETVRQKVMHGLLKLSDSALLWAAPEPW
jgi:hypothetical protein